MIGYHKPVLAAKLPSVKQAFDLVHETDHSSHHGQVKHPSLDDYDNADADAPETWLDTMLDRWGDRRLSHIG